MIDGIVLPRIHPMRLRLVREPFDHPDYIFELKHDGFRAIAYLQHGECRLVSRNQRNLGFASLKKALAGLPVQTAILDGEDLRQRPLVERKKRLARLIQAATCSRLLYAQHIEQHGKGFFAEICARDLEGIVAKRKLGIYKDDGNSWLKVKNRTYSQAEGRHELLTRGG